MMPQELMQMPKGDLLLMRGGIPPVRGRKIEYFRSKRFTSRISDPPKVAPRPITISAAPVTAKLAGEASSSDPLAQALSAKKAALLSDGQAIAPAERAEPVMRALTSDELSGFAEITDDMLVLGTMVDLPPPGDEQAAIAFVTAMTARAVLEPAGAGAQSPEFATERHDHGRE